MDYKDVCDKYRSFVVDPDDDIHLSHMKAIKYANFLEYEEAVGYFFAVAESDPLLPLLLRQAAFFGNISYFRFIESNVRSLGNASYYKLRVSAPGNLLSTLLYIRECFFLVYLHTHTSKSINLDL